MSLKAFHAVFIVASIALSLLAGVWGGWQFTAAGSRSGLGVAIAFAACGVSLVVYGIKALGKLKELA